MSTLTVGGSIVGANSASIAIPPAFANPSTSSGPAEATLFEAPYLTSFRSNGSLQALAGSAPVAPTAPQPQPAAPRQ